MTFCARPNIDDTQFIQVPATTLTLSGQTQIATASGLALTDGIGGYRPIIATGGTTYDVLTLIGNRLVLYAPTASGATSGVYTCASPTTCTVGGITAGSAISGWNYGCLFQTMLVPTLYPTLTAPSSVSTILPTTSTYEVGSSVVVTGCTVFDRGCISPAYCGANPKRSGFATCYEYTVWGVPTCVASSCLSTNKTVFSSHYVTQGSNTISSRVWYSGGTQPLNSSGGTYCAALAAGCTAFASNVFTGIYPYYYGKVASGSVGAGINRPSAVASLITGGTKIVASSTDTVCINFASTSDDYIWFATPNASTTKTKWYVDSNDTGCVGGGISAGCNLFPAPSTVAGVTSSMWANVSCSPQTYKLYISNYQTTANLTMELRNS